MADDQNVLGVCRMAAQEKQPESPKSHSTLMKKAFYRNGSTHNSHAKGIKSVGFISSISGTFAGYFYSHVVFKKKEDAYHLMLWPRV